MYTYSYLFREQFRPSINIETPHQDHQPGSLPAPSGSCKNFDHQLMFPPAPDPQPNTPPVPNPQPKYLVSPPAPDPQHNSPLTPASVSTSSRPTTKNSTSTQPTTQISSVSTSYQPTTQISSVSTSSRPTTQLSSTSSRHTTQLSAKL